MPNEYGIIDSVRIVRLFHERGYDGPVIVEPMAPATTRFETMDPLEVAKESAACLQKVLKEAGVCAQ